MVWFAFALFVVIGSGVVVVALAGGPGGARSLLHRDTPTANWIRIGVLCVILAGGIAVPIAVAVDNGQNKAMIGPGGIALTKNETAGRALFARTCSTCHTLAAAAAVGHVGPNLDTLVPNEALVKYAIANGFARGNGQMPAGIYTGQQAKDVAQFVAATAGQNQN